MPLTQVDQGLLGQYAQYTGFKNRIINGGMVFDQRNNGASYTVVGGNAYALDRWLPFASVTSKFSVQQTSVVPAGFTKSLLATSLSAYSVGASELFNLNQIIEGYNVADLGFGTANAQAFTFSFWVRSSLTGTFAVWFGNSSQNRWYVAPFTINSANTWEYKTVTVPGDTAGTWLTDNGRGLYCAFNLSVGSSFQTSASSAWSGASTMYGITGQQSLVGTNGATMYITGVQLEKGSTATSFDYRPYGTELQLCQRYCTTAGGGSLAQGAQGSTTAAEYNFVFPVSMRAGPTLSYASVGNFSTYSWAAAAGRVATSVSLLNASTRKGTVSFAWSSAMGSAGQIVSSDASNGDFLTFSAEL